MKEELRNRYYSFLAPWFIEGVFSLVMAAMPILAIKYGANYVLLGTIGWVAQALRLPLCITSGKLSEKVDRTKIIIPAAILMALSSVLLGMSTSIIQIIIFYSLCAASFGAFNPPFQALIGDASQRGQLTKNLGAYNIGWCSGAAIAALTAGWLIGINLSCPFFVAGGGAVTAAILVFTWQRKHINIRTNAAEIIEVKLFKDHNLLLIVSRMGLFTGFFSYAIIRIIFPKLGVYLHWPTDKIPKVIAFIMIGQVLGILVTNSSPWWKGKWWPQVLAQFAMLISALLTYYTSSALILGTAFFIIGFAITIAYTAAIYHSLAARENMGKNTGIHEALIAAGCIAGCLLGGIAAQYIAIRAPYLLISVLCLICLITTAILYTKRGDIK